MLWRAGALLLLGEFGGYLLPLLLEPISRTFGVSESTVGFVFALHLGAYALAAIAVAPWLRQLSPRRMALLSVGLIATGNLLSASSTAFAALIAGRIVTGLGEGLAAATAASLLAQAADSQRAFARAFAAVVAMTIAIFVLLPPLFAASNARQAFALLALAPLAWLPWLATLPRSDTSGIGATTTDAEQRSGSLGLPALLVCVAATFISISGNAPWVYLERIATALQMTPATFGQMVSLAAVLALAGPLTAWLLGDRGRAMGPIVIGCLLVAGGAFLATHAPRPLPYALGFAVSSAALLFVTPTMLGLAASIDLSGRAAGAARGFHALGSTLAPATAGAVLGSMGNYRAIGWVSLAMGGVGIALLAAAVTLHARRAGDR